MYSPIPTGRVLSGVVVVVACAAGPAAQTGARLPEMIVTVSTDRDRYGAGDAILLTVAGRNASSEPVVLAFFSSQRYDFTIRSEAGDDVWRWSAEMGFAQVLGEERVEPGATLEYAETFTGTLDPGSYVAHGTITASGVTLEGESRFVVE